MCGKDICEELQWLSENMEQSTSPGRRSDIEEKLDTAWEWVVKSFPFENYIKPERKAAYKLLPRIAYECLGGEGCILDFGAGPADKTAMFSRIGLDVVAFDDFEDPWHRLGNNRQKILDFASFAGIDYCYSTENKGNWPFAGRTFDMLMLHHVLEHLHDSPKDLMVDLIQRVNDGGFVFITVPNAVNLRKRLHVLLGKTNYPPYSAYYWYPGPWRGHIREYVQDDLIRLSRYLGIEIVFLTTYTHFAHAIPRVAQKPFQVLSALVPSFRDSWMLLARKPSHWRPRLDLSGAELAQMLGKGEYFDYASAKSG